MNRPSASRSLHILAIGAAVAASACAARAPTRPATSVIAEADALLAQGCYTCLLEAEQRYRDGAQHGDTAGARRADGASILIALRERELGLPDSGRLAALEQRRGPAATTSDLRLLVEVAKVMRWNRRFAIDEDAALRQTAISSRDTWLPALERLAPHDLAADYLRVSLLCDYPAASGDAATARPTPYAGAPPPLLRFRMGICLGHDIAGLATLVRDVPRFAEAYYFLGTAAVLDGRLDDARTSLAQAFAALPRWPAAANALAGLAIADEDYDTALARYDDALAVDPLHRDALLGRLKALSILERHAEGLAAAERMLELGEYYLGDAHYWRAWNLYHLSRYTDAAHDAETSKRYVRGAAPLALAGHIAAAQGRLDQARSEFVAARAEAPDDCDVRFALGSVVLTARSWTDAAGAFEEALACYERREREVQTEIGRLAPTATRQLAARRREEETTRRQRGAAALQAAVSWLTAGDVDRARAHAQYAMGLPTSADEARKLLDKLP